MAVLYDRWKCCDQKHRSAFCPTCGRKRPVDSPVERAKRLLQEFDDEADRCDRTADTWQSKADEVKQDHELSEPVYPDDSTKDDPLAQRWGDIVRHSEESARGWRKKALRIKSWANVIRDLLESASVDSVSVDCPG